MREYNHLLARFESHGYDMHSPDRWTDLTWQVWAHLMGLFEAAKVLGMGEYTTKRCARSLSGEQYDYEKV